MNKNMIRKISYTIQITKYAIKILFLDSYSKRLKKEYIQHMIANGINAFKRNKYKTASSAKSKNTIVKNDIDLDHHEEQIKIQVNPTVKRVLFFNERYFEININPIIKDIITNVKLKLPEIISNSFKSAIPIISLT